MYYHFLFLQDKLPIFLVLHDFFFIVLKKFNVFFQNNFVLLKFLVPSSPFLYKFCIMIGHFDFIKLQIFIRIIFFAESGNMWIVWDWIEIIFQKLTFVKNVSLEKLTDIKQKFYKLVKKLQWLVNIILCLFIFYACS